jgi:hypothetical protein
MINTVEKIYRENNRFTVLQIVTLDDGKVWSVPNRPRLTQITKQYKSG